MRNIIPAFLFVTYLQVAKRRQVFVNLSYNDGEVIGVTRVYTHFVHGIIKCTFMIIINITERINIINNDSRITIRESW